MVLSHHPGEPWSSEIEQVLERQLAGQCRIEKFYLDSRRKRADNLRTDQARLLVEQLSQQLERLDVVVAVDDQAIRYLVEPYQLQHKVPVVFCGINWDGAAYGYPAANVTGMVEVVPVPVIAKWVGRLVPKQLHGVYLADNSVIEQENYVRIAEMLALYGITLTPSLVESQLQWEEAFQAHQKEAGFVYLGGVGGFQGWNPGHAQQWVEQNSKRLTVTHAEAMMDYAMLGFTHSATEQGEWAAEYVQQILQGQLAGQLPIVSSRKYNRYLNQALLSRTGLEVPQELVSTAVVWGEEKLVLNRAEQCPSSGLRSSMVERIRYRLPVSQDNCPKG